MPFPVTLERYLGIAHANFKGWLLFQARPECLSQLSQFLR